MKKAQAKTTHGAESTQTDGLIRNNVYHASVPAMKMEQMMYKSVSFSVLDPESKLNWKEVCNQQMTKSEYEERTADKSCPRAIITVYMGQPKADL